MNPFEEGLRQYLSEDELKKIQSVKIGIGGAGGLGSNIAIILARTGFKNFEILDYDIIEPSNLNRQQYFINEIGKSKVDILKARLLKINPDLDCVTLKTEWSTETGDKFFNNCNIIIEAFDTAEFKSSFVEYYQDKAEFIISGNGMAGLLKKKPMKINRVGNIFLVGDSQTDTACGNPPLAPRVITCAAMMSEIVLDLTLELKHFIY